MIVDTSALVSLVLEEPRRESLFQKIDNADVVFVGAPSALEAAMVLSGPLKRDVRPVIAAMLRRMQAEVVPFTEEHFETAISAFLRFGKGRHPAGLNFGDCMSYALARVSGHPLLYCGNDFSRTDVRSA